VMSVGTLKTVLLSVWIEVRSCRLEIGAITLGRLMKMDPVRPRRQAVQVEFEPHTRALRTGSAFRYRNRAYAISLGIFHLDHSLGHAGKRPENYRERYGGNEKSFAFHDPRL
jgi:hypothetical protein